MPYTQNFPGLQRLLHCPQCRLSYATSTHCPRQHSPVYLHFFLHPPQLCLSCITSTHLLLQHSHPFPCIFSHIFLFLWQWLAALGFFTSSARKRLKLLDGNNVVVESSTTPDVVVSFDFTKVFRVIVMDRAMVIAITSITFLTSMASSVEVIKRGARTGRFRSLKLDFFQRGRRVGR